MCHVFPSLLLWPCRPAAYIGDDRVVSCIAPDGNPIGFSRGLWHPLQLMNQEMKQTLLGGWAPRTCKRLGSPPFISHKKAIWNWEDPPSSFKILQIMEKNNAMSKENLRVGHTIPLHQPDGSSFRIREILLDVTVMARDVYT